MASATTRSGSSPTPIAASPRFFYQASIERRPLPRAGSSSADFFLPHRPIVLKHYARSIVTVEKIMATTPTAQYLYMLDEDLYRLGNATSPKLHNVRPDDVQTYDRNGILMSAGHRRRHFGQHRGVS